MFSFPKRRIYYQNSEFLRVPFSCEGIFNSPTDAHITTQSLYGCRALAAVVRNFTTNNCEASFSKICAESYTDNPPFSCSTNVRPDFLTTLGELRETARALRALCLPSSRVICEKRSCSCDYAVVITLFLPIVLFFQLKFQLIPHFPN